VNSASYRSLGFPLQKERKRKLVCTSQSRHTNVHVKGNVIDSAVNGLNPGVSVVCIV